MSALSNALSEGNNGEKEYGKGTEKTEVGIVPPEGVSIREGSDILALQEIDPALNAKMHIVNNVGSQKRHSRSPDFEAPLIF